MRLVGEMVQEETRKWSLRYKEDWLPRCPECGSSKIEKLNSFKGMFHKGKGKNLQKMKCNECNYKWFVEI